MTVARQLILNVNLLTAGAHPAAWRSPHGNPRAPGPHPATARGALRPRRRAAVHGRTLEILPGVNPIVGSTEAEARALRAELDTHVSEQDRLRGFAAFVGLDPDSLSPDQVFTPDLLPRGDDTYGSVGFTEGLRTLLSSRPFTVRELLGTGTFHRDLVGSPEQIADSLQQWFEAGAADGFILQFAVYPGGLTDFVDHVIPILRRRGLFRTAYAESTLRARLGLDRPRSRFTPVPVTH